ncbi:MAG: DMT family transporter [Desulfobacterales bacterium]|jgi:drug/metabolite transporter (DMT)-like permease
MLAVGLALIACLSWGISSFLAGTKSRVIPVLTLLVFSSMAGLGMFLTSVGLRGVPLPRDPNLLYAVLGGAVGVGGLYCLYRGLAEGAISIVVPISALCVLLPVFTGLALGEVLHPLQALGIVIAIGGGVTVSLEKNAAANKKRFAAGILPALGAAMGFGAFYVVMDLAGAVDPLWAAMVSRLSFLLFLLPAVLTKRPCLKIKTAHLPAVFAIGILDGTAALAYTTATTKGLMSLVSVISSLYPAVSVILAALFLKERLRGLQFFGVVLAILGVALISAG